MDEKFHVLDNVTLYDRDKLQRRRRAARQPMLPLSSFLWNEVIFRSFKAGNLKSIDFDLFRRLESAVAKRLYRFLDKRFFHRPRWEFHLKEFCWEHVGLSRHYDTAQLKRKLRPAIQELERQGFLQTISEMDRFRKIRSGQWRIVFEKANAKATRADGGTATDAALEQALIARGVTPSVARETVAAFSPERIQPQLEVLDWLLEQRDAKVLRNPAGFLISSIKSEYAPPKGFLTRAEQELRARKAADRQQQLATRKQAILATEQAKLQAREVEIARFWRSLSRDERLRLEQEALTQSPPFQRELVAREGKLGAAARKNLLDAYALKMLQAGG